MAKVNWEAMLASIRRSQLPSGGFSSHSSPSVRPFIAETSHQTTFAATAIGLALAQLPDSPQQQKVASGIVRFLRQQAGKNSSFNYWVKNSRERTVMPYPDDLDDTFCALAALSQLAPTTIDGTVLANIANILITTERKPGGPYRTWIVNPVKSKKTWLDIDLAVNANVGYFLSLQDITMPGINRLIERAITANRFYSPYYPNEYPVIYFISRFYGGRLRHKLLRQIMARQRQGHWGSPLATALMVSSALNLGGSPADTASAVQYLQRSAGDNGWPAEGFCLDPAVNGKPRYAGSAVLTTALCLEALALFEQKTVVEIPVDTGEEEFFTAVEAAKTEMITALPKALRNDFFVLADKLVSFDRQIVLLPYWFFRSIHSQHTVTKGCLVNLALANLCGWMAYTVYDDFFDGEGEPIKLSLANFCLRRMTVIFTQEITDRQFHNLFNRIMNELDKANRWEAATLRCNPTSPIAGWPALKKRLTVPSLAEKSLGHYLTPAAVLFAAGVATEKNLAVTEQLFRHYLAARQLNDDAHDWAEDLLAGQVTYAIQQLCLDAKKSTLRLPAKPATILLKETFWQTTVARLMKQGLRQLNQARRLTENRLFAKPEIISEKILQGPSQTAKKTLAEQRMMTQFLDRFRVK